MNNNVFWHEMHCTLTLIYQHFRTSSPHLQGIREPEIPHVCIEQFPATQEKITKLEQTSVHIVQNKE
jgi:hypothetical protein